MKHEEKNNALSNHYAPYARILGFRKSAAVLLKAINQKSRIPCIQRLSEAGDLLDPAQSRLLKLDIHAADVYNIKLSGNSDAPWKNEFRQPLIYI